MLLSDFVAAMERIAPPELAMDFDNVGLLVSPATDQIRRVLVALDCSVARCRTPDTQLSPLFVTRMIRYVSGTPW